MSTINLSRRQLSIATLGGIAVLLPWPAEILGAYGSKTTGDSATDEYALAQVAPDLNRYNEAAHSDTSATLAVAGVCAGRAYRRGVLTPCIVVKVSLALRVAQGGFQVRRQEWVDGVAAR